MRRRIEVFIGNVNTSFFTQFLLLIAPSASGILGGSSAKGAGCRLQVTGAGGVIKNIFCIKTISNKSPKPDKNGTVRWNVGMFL